MSHRLHFSLSGLSCNHCVSQVKKVLEQRDDVSSAEVDLHQATVETSAEASALIATIEQEGYHATLKA